MKIRVEIQGGATVTFQGPLVEEIFEVLKGYCSEDELDDPNTSILMDSSKSVRVGKETVITV